MLDRHDTRTITVLVEDVLITLKKNLKEHQVILAEARIGYIKKAKKALVERHALLEEGKLVNMHFDLSIPTDHSKEFETAITMMEMHRDAHNATRDAEIPATYEFKAQDVQQFILNNWMWMDTFLISNAGYSDSSRMLATEKGLI